MDTMIDLNLTYQTKTASTEEIYLHLKKCNNDFIPPLDQKVNLHEYSKKIFEKAITFEAWINKILVGLVAVYFNDVEKYFGYITNVSVLKDYKGKRIAYELMNRCIEYAKQHNFDQIILEVSSDNYEAIQLYKKFNFAAFENKNNMIGMKMQISDIDS